MIYENLYHSMRVRVNCNVVAYNNNEIKFKNNEFKNQNKILSIKMMIDSFFDLLVARKSV